ncbi:hypothetical protein [Paenibacillus sp. sgz302251]|uniref:hypothetical protein n=1 Tax=Paenibacillus sp. sgz302251 TaxID=3414493 RepID=UPI003C7E0D4C
MRKRKWKKILIWTVSVIVLIGIGGLFAANYAVNKLISTLAADLETEHITEVQPTEVVDAPDGEEPPAEETETEETNESDPASQVPMEQEADKSVEQEAAGADEQDKSNEEGYRAEVSIEKAKTVQEKITVSEKAQVTSVLLKELNMSDMKELQELASGGLSAEEKKKARTIILERLSADQYDELIQIAKKYGLSQGKSYEEVSKEK